MQNKWQITYVFQCLWSGELTGEATFPKSSSPSEPLPSSLHLENVPFEHSSCVFLVAHIVTCYAGQVCELLIFLCFAHIATFASLRPHQEGPIISLKFWKEAFSCLQEVRADSYPSVFFFFFFLFLIRILSFLCVLERSWKTFVVKARAMC